MIVLLALNWGAAVARYQANTLYWDQWGFCEPLFNSLGPAAEFMQQLGPHRQGVAFVLTAQVMRWSDWDTRVESLWISGWLAVAAGLMLVWKRRLTGRLGWEDLWIPLAALSLRQFENVVLIPNASHSVFPLVLVMVAALVLTRPLTLGRGLGLGVVGFLALFTGFGIFLWAALVGLSGLWLLRAWRNGRRAEGWGMVAGAVLLVVALGLFLQGYVRDPSADEVTKTLSDYPKFVVLMLASRMELLQLTPLTWVAGSVVAVMGVGAFAHACWRVVKDQSTTAGDVSAALLLGTGLGFACFTAMGRAHLGIEAAQASRYTPLLITIWLGLLAWAAARDGRIWRILPALLGWAMVGMGLSESWQRPWQEWPGRVGMSRATHASLENVLGKKLEWLEVWETTGDWREAERRVPMGVHGDAASAQLDRKIQFLRDHRLSFAAHPEQRRAWLPWWNPSGVRWVRSYGGEQRHWMAEEALLLVEARPDRFLNLQFLGAADLMPSNPEVEVALGEQVGRLRFADLRAGISIPAPTAQSWLTLRSVQGTVPLNPPALMLPGSFEVIHPTITEGPLFARWQWGEEGTALWPERMLRIEDGFYAWESEGAFAWTTARLELSVQCVEPSFLNVEIASRFGAVDHGPVAVRIDGVETQLPWVAGGLRFALPVAGGGRTQTVELVNVAGSSSPLAEGRSADSRQLALRLTRMSLDPAAAFPVMP